MIMSLHMPKTAGLSLRYVLKDYYGSSLIEDYNDLPLNTPLPERYENTIKFNNSMNLLKRTSYKIKRIKCIHGHFLFHKYNKLTSKNAKSITWLREPTERLVSQYYYKQRTYGKHSGALHKRVVEEKWSLEKFCLSNELRNVYDQFLWKSSIEEFDFIGITEFFEEDLHFFAKKYLHGYDLTKIPQININDDQDGKYAKDLPAELVDRIKEFHAKDYEIYNYALRMRKERYE